MAIQLMDFFVGQENCHHKTASNSFHNIFFGKRAKLQKTKKEYHTLQWSDFLLKILEQ